MARPVSAMILGAGRGTRLAPLTDWIAKPMVPIGDRPAVAHATERVRLAVDRIVVNVHHRPDDLARWAEEEGIAVSHEVELLGTAGGVARAHELLGDGDVLVWNADIVSALDAREIELRDGNLATLAVAPRFKGSGTVGTAADGRVVRLRGQVFGEEVRGGDFLGIHVLSAALRASLPAVGCLVADVYLPALRRGARIATTAVNAAFTDIGTLAEYAAANRNWLATRGLASWVAADADVSAAVDGSVVGAGARVEAAAVRSVVWPGARVVSATADMVVTPWGTVRLVD